MPPRQRQVPLHLPEAVWLKIAEHLPLQEWAKASGTCRTTRGLQLENVKIPAGTSAQGVVWASQRLSCVRALRLQAFGVQEVAQAAGQGTGALQCLTDLELDSLESREYSHGFCLCLTWLLSQAPALTLFSATLGGLGWLPPLVQLKHLTLTLTGTVGGGFQALSYASGLQTLCLASEELGNGSPSLDAPVLFLARLQQLQKVALHGVRPANMTLPVACQLTLTRVDEQDLRDNQWSDAQINLHIFKATLLSVDLEGVPSVLRHLTGLNKVYLRVRMVGTPNVPLDLTPLAHVNTLFLDGINVTVRVPFTVTWKLVVLMARHDLMISFDSFASFARYVPKFWFSYESLRGPWLGSLCASLALHGKLWASGASSTDARWSVINSAHMTKGCMAFVNGACYCGACLTCLRGSGSDPAAAEQEQRP